MKRRLVFPALLVGGAALGVPMAALPKVVSINDAINKAGRQRMLSQRAAKSYMALGQNVLPDLSQKVLAASLALFDAQLVELAAYSPTAEIGATYNELKATWAEYKAAVSKVPDLPGAERVILLSGKVLQLANRGTVQLEGVSGNPTGQLINVAGRQRMLSQRMAAFYLASSWHVQGVASLAVVTAARDEFVKAHLLLRSAPETTESIKSELAIADMQFTFFEAALQSLKPGESNAQASANVFTTSERILQVMNNVTGMYEKLT